MAEIFISGYKADNLFVASWCRVVLFHCYIVEIAKYGNLAMYDNVTYVMRMNYFDILILITIK